MFAKHPSSAQATLKPTQNYFKTFNQLNFIAPTGTDLWAMENRQSIEETILMYTSAWNETGREAIAEKIEQCWAPEGTYTDKLINTIQGQQAITEMIANSYAQMGPRTFKVLSAPDIHHQSGRFRWLAIRPQGYPTEGMDYFEFDTQNRITRIVGFF